MTAPVKQSADISEEASTVRLLLLDVDGVMTDGSIVYADTGDELKSFNARDGHGIKLLMRAGIDVAIVTGRSSRAVQIRADDLGIGTVYQKALRKIEAYEDILQTKKLDDKQICAVGDDLPDLPILKRCGLSVAVPDAVPEVLAAADMVTRCSGGKGAVREVCDFLLKASGRWHSVTARYFEG